MNHSKIDTALANYKAALKTIDEKRNYWKQTTKPLLQKELGSVAEKYPGGLYSQSFGITNNEVVNITFGNFPSGVSHFHEHGGRHWVKYGGTLVFTQSVTGNIFVILVYSYVEEITTPIPNKLFAEISPQDITEAFISDQVVKFLEELTRYESNNPYSEIGFRIPQSE